MTREETKRLLRIMASLYPNWKADNPSLTVDAWTAVLANEDGQEMADALKLYARRDTSGFSPAPGQLIALKDSARWERVEAEITAKIYGLPETEAAKMIGG